MEYFVRIEEPKKLRVALMSAARDVVLMQTALGELQALRKEKSSVVSAAKDDFRQITSMCRKLSETIADEKARREILNSLRPREPEHAAVFRREAPPLKERQMRPAQKAAQKRSNDMLPEITENDLPMVSRGIKMPDLKMSGSEAKTEVDRLGYTLAQIEKKLAELNK
jgi:hypothetical protein